MTQIIKEIADMERIGDIYSVDNTNRCYSTYKQQALKMGAKNFVEGFIPLYGAEATLLSADDHPHSGTRLFLCRADNGNEFVIDRDSTSWVRKGKKEPTPMIEMILDKINLVSLNVNIWQGKKAMTPEDLAANGVDTSLLPPATLANLGSKRIVAPEAIAPFNVLKRTAAKECAKYGVRFGNCGYAVPEDRMDALCAKLKELQTTFRLDAEDFVLNYSGAVDKWITENPPEWAAIIRAAADSPNHVKESLSFKFSAMKVVPPKDGIENGLEEEVGSLYSQLCHEVRGMAKIAYETSYAGKSEVSRRAVRPVAAIREKLQGMTFLDPSIDATITAIDTVMTEVDKWSTKGPISGKELNMLSGLLGNQLMHLGRPKASELIEEPEEELILVEEQPAQQTTTLESLNWDF